LLGHEVNQDEMVYLWRYKKNLLLIGESMLRDRDENKTLPGRLKLFEWLLVDKGIRIPAFRLIQSHEPHLLRRMHELGRLDLDATPDAESRAHATSLEWLQPALPSAAKAAKKGKKQHARQKADAAAIAGCAKMADLLALLCAGYGVYAGLTYILEVAPLASKASYGGLNLLHVAARQGHAEVVAMLVKRQLVPCNEFAGSLNAAHLALRAGECWCHAASTAHARFPVKGADWLYLKLIIPSDCCLSNQE
jgi:hypothetical protein